MHSHLLKFLATAFTIFFLFSLCLSGWANQNSESNLSFNEVENPPMISNSIKVVKQSHTNLTANSFDFNDGALQDWTIVGPLDEDANGLFSSHFSNSWADAVSYPTSVLSDPIGNGNGSNKICNVMGHGITNPGATWCVLDFTGSLVVICLAERRWLFNRIAQLYGIDCTGARCSFEPLYKSVCHCL